MYILDTDQWGHSLKLLMTAVVAGGAVVMALMAYMQGQVMVSCIEIELFGCQLLKLLKLLNYLITIPVH